MVQCWEDDNKSGFEMDSDDSVRAVKAQMVEMESSTWGMASLNHCGGVVITNTRMWRKWGKQKLEREATSQQCLCLQWLEGHTQEGEYHLFISVWIAKKVWAFLYEYNENITTIKTETVIPF